MGRSVEVTITLGPDQVEVIAQRVAEIVRAEQPAPAPSSPYLSPAEAAGVLRCRKRRVYELVGDGRLCRHGEGRRLLVSRAEVERLAAGTVTK